MVAGASCLKAPAQNVIGALQEVFGFRPWLLQKPPPTASTSKASSTRISRAWCVLFMSLLLRSKLVSSNPHQDGLPGSKAFNRDANCNWHYGGGRGVVFEGAAPECNGGVTS